MTRKRLFLIAGLLAALASTGIFFALLMPDPKPGVNLTNINLLEKRMKLKEVEEIFGRSGTLLPRGDYLWMADDGFAVVVLFENEHVDRIYSNDSKQSLLGKIRGKIRGQIPW